jgi:hydrogenase maturation protease
MMEAPLRKIVLGLGNILNRDEGLGVHAVKALQEQTGSQAGVKVEFVDGGVLGMNLLMLVEDCSHLLVLDAVDARKAPGTLVELSREQIPLYAGIKMSEHQVTFQEVLGLANIRGKLPPHLHLIGIQPVDLSIGLGMSPLVEATLPALYDGARAMLAQWGLLRPGNEENGDTE